MIEAGLGEGVVSRGVERGLLDVAVHDLRRWTTDRHPNGRRRAVWRRSRDGDEGRAADAGGRARFGRRAGRRTPWCCCHRRAGRSRRPRPNVSPASGTSCCCAVVTRGWTSGCGTWSPPRRFSIGDYVLSGGELAALVIVDAVSRLVPGVVGDEQSVAQDSFARGLLDYPHYTRPAEIAGHRVPDVLLSGHHADVRRWRRKAALVRTLDRRPDLIATATLDEEERELLDEIRRERSRR